MKNGSCESPESHGINLKRESPLKTIKKSVWQIWKVTNLLKVLKVRKVTNLLKVTKLDKSWLPIQLLKVSNLERIDRKVFTPEKKKLLSVTISVLLIRNTICTGELATNLNFNFQQNVTGWRHQTFLITGQRIKHPKIICLKSNKIRNRMKRMINGNRGSKDNLKIIHWNMGAKLWENKLLEIQAVILQYKPDIYAVSEANMKLNLQAHQKQIQGYKMYLPRTVEMHNHARLVVLVRDDLEVHIQNQHMDTTALCADY